MDGRCETCKWWGRSSMNALDPEGNRPEWGECRLVESDIGEPRHWQSRAVAMDAAPASAFLLTAPDFGCVQWEAKESS